MPTYTYHCDFCDNPFEKVLPVSRYDEPQDCADCGEGPARKTITGVSFILRGDGWAGKNLRVASQMREKNRRLDAKQSDRQKDATNISLFPNVEGEGCDSWSEAAKLAKSKGKKTEGYEKRARQEKKA